MDIDRHGGVRHHREVGQVMVVHHVEVNEVRRGLDHGPDLFAQKAGRNTYPRVEGRPAHGETLYRHGDRTGQCGTIPGSKPDLLTARPDTGLGPNSAAAAASLFASTRPASARPTIAGDYRARLATGNPGHPDRAGAYL